MTKTEFLLHKFIPPEIATPEQKHCEWVNSEDKLQPRWMREVFLEWNPTWGSLENIDTLHLLEEHKTICVTQ